MEGLAGLAPAGASEQSLFSCPFQLLGGGGGAPTFLGSWPHPQITLTSTLNLLFRVKPLCFLIVRVL